MYTRGCKLLIVFVRRSGRLRKVSVHVYCEEGVVGGSRLFNRYGKEVGKSIALLEHASFKGDNCGKLRILIRRGGRGW